MLHICCCTLKPLAKNETKNSIKAILSELDEDKVTMNKRYH